ncbi:MULTISPECIES: AbiH family protein [Agrobacterium]|uniref:AbiH family protein n=1 Tax=Agrobacterium tumefaciens TaxID=358 RepID=A0AAF0GUE9_AGRTU|nr:MULTISPECIES: AbiH family protein [Agrobacterium]WGM58364.1 AbiH family protein [Agrobacterium tumefaciens]
MGKRLYIIGNGFDLAHGIPSSYSSASPFNRQPVHPRLAISVENHGVGSRHATSCEVSNAMMPRRPTSHILGRPTSFILVRSGVS